MRLTKEREQEIREFAEQELLPACVYELLQEIEALRADVEAIRGERDYLAIAFNEKCEQRAQLMKERDALRAAVCSDLNTIAAQSDQLDRIEKERDHTYVICLKEENQKLRKRVAKYEHALEAIAECETIVSPDGKRFPIGEFAKRTLAADEGDL